LYTAQKSKTASRTIEKISKIIIHVPAQLTFY
jgi:hypothetical protein